MAAQILGGAHFFFLWQAQKSGGAKAPPAPLEITPLDIKEFDPDEKTVTLFVNLFSYWNDSRVMLKSSDLNQ